MSGDHADRFEVEPPRRGRHEIGRLALLLSLALAFALVPAGAAFADGPSGSTECHLADDDCDGAIDEDPVGDGNGDGNADDDGDGGVDEDTAGNDDGGGGEVTCNSASSQSVGLVYLYTGSNGAEICADGTQGCVELPQPRLPPVLACFPASGRAILTTDQGGYASIDGSPPNVAPADGYLRVDGSGFHCGNETNQDSTAPDQTQNTSADCG